ncbi:amidohydrolase family protein [Micromonospora globbae]|uniref:Amidohydrolase family protein n=1 Tax=Micromonospora globbae TaxID=1894969 RepID=A0ABZ1SBT6_9ACTN|nr:amidohydrolase family protein [Micromonospora globbae]
MIIDVHAHWGPWFFSMEVGAVATNLAVMDRYGIDLAVVSATEAVIYDPTTGNRAMARVLETTDRLLGYLTINPRRLDDAERDLRELLPTGRFVGVKIHTDYTGSPPSTPQTRAALELAAAHDLPALVHTWDRSPLDLAAAVADIPGLRAIAGHMGANGWRHAVEAANSVDRLWLEPCFSHTEAGRFAAVAAAVDPHRLLFGTDATLIDPAAAYGAVLAADLEPELAERVAWRNAADLFRLERA